MDLLLLPHEPRHDQADADPEGAEDLGAVAEVNPDEAADQNSQRGDEERKRDFLLRAELVVDQSGEIDAHEGDERAKVEQFGSLLVAKQEGARHGDRTDDQNVIARNMVLTIDRAKDSRRQRIISSHAVHEPGGTELRGDSRSQICDQQRCVEQLKQERAAYARGDMNKCGVHHGGGKWSGGRPDDLRHIDLNHGQDPDDQAGEDSCQQDVAARILHLFGHGRDSVKANIGEDGDRSSLKDSRGREGRWDRRRAGADHAPLGCTVEKI